MKTIVPLLAIVTMLTSLNAFAQKENQDEIRYHRKDYVDFTEKTVIGNRSNSGIIYTHIRGPVHFRSLIKMRSHFRPELASSVPKLK